MKATIKTDEFIRLLNEVIFCLYYPISHLSHKVGNNDELFESIKNSNNKGAAIRSYYANKAGKGIFNTDIEALNHIFNKDRVLRTLTENRALIDYRLCPAVILNVGIQDKGGVLEFMNKHNIWTGEPYFDEVWNVLQREIITVEDLKNEFWDICPDVDSIPKYLQVIRVKFRETLKKVPDREYYSLENLLFNNDNTCANDIKKLQDVGLLTDREVDSILGGISIIVEGINFAIDRIIEMYNELKAMATTGNIESVPIPTATSKPKQANENQNISNHIFYPDAIPSFLENEKRLIADKYIDANLIWIQPRKKRDLAEFIVVLKENGYFKKRGSKGLYNWKDYKLFFEQRYRVDISKQMQPANRPNPVVCKTFGLYPIVKQK